MNQQQHLTNFNDKLNRHYVWPPTHPALSRLEVIKQKIQTTPNLLQQQLLDHGDHPRLPYVTDGTSSTNGVVSQ